MIGLFGLLLMFAKEVTGNIRQNIEMQVFLNKNLAENDKIKLHKSFELQPYILKETGIAGVEYIPKEVAAEDFIKETGEDFMKFLGDNPLRDAFILRIAPEYQLKDSLDMIQKEIMAKNGIFEVVYMESLVDSINNNMAKISLILVGVAIVLIVVTIVLINNTIKLALFSQRFLIRSMQLVGAKMSFIRKPFLMRSLFHGILAGVIASILLFTFLKYFYSKIPDLSMLQNENELIVLFSGLIIMGAIIALLSTYSSVNKYMNMSLDELY